MDYLLTFLEGLASFISPCMLPMIPLYLSYFAGENQNEQEDTQPLAIDLNKEIAASKAEEKTAEENKIAESEAKPTETKSTEAAKKQDKKSIAFWQGRCFLCLGLPLCLSCLAVW